MAEYTIGIYASMHHNFTECEDNQLRQNMFTAHLASVKGDGHFREVRFTQNGRPSESIVNMNTFFFEKGIYMRNLPGPIQNIALREYVVTVTVDLPPSRLRDFLDSVEYELNRNYFNTMVDDVPYEEICVDIEAKFHRDDEEREYRSSNGDCDVSMGDCHLDEQYENINTSSVAKRPQRGG